MVQQKEFNPKKMLVWKKMLVQKKNLVLNKILVWKQILVQKKIVIEKKFWPKNFFQKKFVLNFGPKLNPNTIAFPSWTLQNLVLLLLLLN